MERTAASPDENRPRSDRDLERVLVRAMDGDATPQETAWLNDRLRDEPELRKRACKFLVDDSLLTEELGLTADLDSLQPTPAGAAEGVARRWPGLLGVIDRHGMAVAAIAAVLLAALTVQNLVTMRKIDRLHSMVLVEGEGVDEAAAADGPGDGWAPTPPPTVVGRVTGLEAAEWEDGATPLRFGQSLTKGQPVRLKSGVIELLLATGAKVTIEGPAHFEASSVGESALTWGKIAAAVPRAARGYTILTPTSEVIDIGTQFGVAVEETGDTELHVFDGDVMARPLQDGPEAELVHYRQDEAMRFGAANHKPTRIAARTANFVRRLGPQVPADRLPPLPVTGGLELWYAADMMPGEAVGEPVDTWRDLLIGDNSFADDAWQFDERRRPLLVEDESGRRALRFDGWSTYLATSPMETANQQTVVLAYAPGPTSFANKYHGGILLKYPVSSPSLELAVFADRSTRGWVWPGPNSQENVGVVRSSSSEDLGVSLVTYRYDTVAGLAELWFNGVSQGTAPAPLAIHEAGRRYLGGHPNEHIDANFFGNLYEVLIYNEAVVDQTLQQLHGYLKGRYGLD